MTTSPCNHRAGRRARGGFTLVEVLMASAIGSIVLAGVLTTFIMLVRSSERLGNYSIMEAQTRRAFEQMGIDARMASDFTANFTSGTLTSFTLTIPSTDLSTLQRVTYGYYGTSGNYTFYYIPGSTPATGLSSETTRVDLIKSVSSVTILRYDTNYNLITTTTSPGIRHLQLSVNVSRGGVGIAAATQIIRSSAFTIRNITL